MTMNIATEGKKRIRGYGFPPKEGMRSVSPFCLFGLMLLILQCGSLSIAFAASSVSGFSFGTSQALDRASVSVVRLVVTYTAAPAPPPRGCQLSLTGLGVLVGSWASSPGSTMNNWVLTDGSLVNPAGLICTLGKPPVGPLAHIQVFASDAYTNASTPLPLASLSCQSGSACHGILCQVSPGCSGGTVLFSFSTGAPEPFIAMAPATSATSGTPIGIELTGPASLPPNPGQAPQYLTPTQVPSLTDANNEPGMPIVNSLGQLVDMNTKAGDTGGSITSFVTGKLAPAPLQAANTNALRDAWDNGITAYYAGNSANARTDWQHAGTLNRQFQAPAAFLNVIATPTSTSQQPSSSGGAPSSTGQNTNLFGFLPNSQLFWPIVAGVLLLVILLAALSFLLIRRQARHRRELARFEEEQRFVDQKADMDAARIAEQEKIEHQQTPAQLQQAASVSASVAAPASLPISDLHCPRCGQPVKAKDRSCSNCLFSLLPTESGVGQHLTIPPVASSHPVLPTREAGPPVPVPNISPLRTLSCPHCHLPRPTGAVFCAHCGFSLSPLSENQTEVIPFPSAKQQRLDPVTAPASIVPVQPFHETAGKPVPEAKEEDEKVNDRVGQRMGNYQLIRLLGEGGFAEVYLGEHIHLGSLAAIKVLHSKLNSEEKEKFRTEARTIVRLIHPHIVRILDFGIEDNVPFLVMDYAQYGTLRQRHPKGTCLPLALVVSYVRQIADGLQFAHNEKVIHRDIKPENMLVGRSNEILLSDFGIAVLAQSSRFESTLDMAGTIAYMSPEQIQGKPRAASDQYALGIVTYEWLCGRRPFEGSLAEVASQHIIAAPPSLCQQIPALSSAVEKIVLKALAKNPKERFESIQAFAVALQEVL